MLTGKAETTFKRVEKSFQEAFETVDSGVFEVKFMSMGRDTEVSPLVSTISENISKTMLKKLIDEVGLDTISSLREEMCEAGGKGAWLSGHLKYDCLSEELTVDFNYDKRFNVLSENWEFNDTDENAIPNRKTLIADFNKHARNPENTPEWLSELIVEQQQIDETIETSNPEDVFVEQLEAFTSLYEKFETVVDSENWQELWEELGETYEETLLSDLELVPLFVDDSNADEQANYIFNVFEPKVVELHLSKILMEISPEEKADLLNVLQISKGESPEYDADYDDYDLELLDEEFEDVLRTMVMSQTQQRFPDLEEWF